MSEDHPHSLAVVAEAVTTMIAGTGATVWFDETHNAVYVTTNGQNNVVYKHGDPIPTAAQIAEIVPPAATTATITSTTSTSAQPPVIASESETSAKAD